MPRFVGKPRDVELRSLVTRRARLVLHRLPPTSSARAPSANELGSFSYPDLGRDASRRRDAPILRDAPIRWDAVFTDQNELGSFSTGFNQQARLILHHRISLPTSLKSGPRAEEASSVASAQGRTRYKVPIHLMSLHSHLSLLGFFSADVPKERTPSRKSVFSRLGVRTLTAPGRSMTELLPSPEPKSSSDSEVGG